MRRLFPGPRPICSSELAAKLLGGTSHDATSHDADAFGKSAAAAVGARTGAATTPPPQARDEKLWS